LAATNKYLALMNKSADGGRATNERSALEPSSLDAKEPALAAAETVNVDPPPPPGSPPEAPLPKDEKPTTNGRGDFKRKLI
jgi:hypothetical protein